MPIPWPPEARAAVKIGYLPDGRFDDDSRARMPHHCAKLRPGKAGLPEIVDSFTMTKHPPLFSEGMRAMVTAHDPQLCDFVKVGRVWDLGERRERTEKTYHFTALRLSRDVWHPEKADIRFCGMGSWGQKIHEVVPPYVIDKTRLDGLWL